MRKSPAHLAALATAALLASACGFEHTRDVLIPTGPSGTSAAAPPAAPPAAPAEGAPSSSIVGTWTSDSFAAPSPSSCSNFQLRVTSQTATSLTGDFFAACAGGLTLSGSASGQLSGTTVTVDVSGNASLPNLPSCHFDLVGNGTIENADTLRIPYTGQTCLGPVRGTEVLRRPAPASTPPPAPAPQPAPPAPADPLFGCGGIADHLKLVECIHDAIRPRDEFGAFEVTKRVAWALRGEGAGLLIKNAGENIVSWQGRSFSASRICYPDGHIYKVISDAGPGGANGASWQDNGFVDRSLYVPAIDPNS